MTEAEAIREIGEDKHRAMSSARASWIDAEKLWASPTAKKVFFQNWLKANDAKTIWREVRKDPTGEPEIHFIARPSDQTIARIHRLLGV